VQPTRVSQMLKSAQARAQAHLQHWGLRLIEITPAPQKFALRNALFTRLSFLFQDTPSFTVWQKAFDYFVTQRQTQINLIDLAALPIPQQLPMKKIALHAHLFYPEFAFELAQLLGGFPVPFDLLLSTPDDQAKTGLQTQFQGINQLQHLEILITPNRGRDIAPMLVGFRERLAEYDYFAHVHTKKSIATNSIGDAWRAYLWHGLLDSTGGRTLKILALLERYGLVYPQKFPLIDVKNCQWNENYDRATALCELLHLPQPAPGFIEFPVGSMFWANTSAVALLLSHPFALEDFEAESGQTDRTFMHTLERSFSHITLSQGSKIGILKNPNFPLYYP